MESYDKVYEDAPKEMKYLYGRYSGTAGDTAKAKGIEKKG